MIRKAAQNARPIRTATRVGDQVASQRCPILHAGINIVTNLGEIAKKQTEYFS